MAEEGNKKESPAKALMTGNAFTMTIPQLDNVLKKLNVRLKDKNVAENSTLRTKVENLIYDYTKAKNKILRYYEKTKSRHPELVLGKKNTLTLVKIAQLSGKDSKANKLMIRKQKAAYNFIDFAKDTKGAMIGVAATTAAIGVANIITTSITNNTLGIAEVIAKGIGIAWKYNPSTTLLMGAAVVLGVALVIIPKIARMLHKIKMNKNIAREMNNEILQEASENDIDLKNQSVEEIAQRLADDPELLKELSSNALSLSKYNRTEKAKLRSAMLIAEEQIAKDIRENLTKAGYAEHKRAMHDEYVEEFDEAYRSDRDADKAGKIKEILDKHDHLIMDMKDNDFDSKKAAKVAADKDLTEKETALKKAEAKLEDIENSKKDIENLIDYIKTSISDPSLAASLDLDDLRAKVNAWYENIKNLDKLMKASSAAGFCGSSVSLNDLTSNFDAVFDPAKFDPKSLTAKQLEEINDALGYDKKNGHKFKVNKSTGEISYIPFKAKYSDASAWLKFKNLDEFKAYIKSQVKGVEDSKLVISNSPDLSTVDFSKLDNLAAEYIENLAKARKNVTSARLARDKALTNKEAADAAYAPVSHYEKEHINILKQLKELMRDNPEIKAMFEAGTPITPKDYVKTAKEYCKTTLNNITEYNNIVAKLKDLGFKTEEEMLTAVKDLKMRGVAPIPDIEKSL